jgi:carbon-monoxide dehydrogenase large subunit
MPAVVGVLTGRQIVDDKVGNLICGCPSPRRMVRRKRWARGRRWRRKRCAKSAEGDRGGHRRTKNQAKDGGSRNLVDYEEFQAVPDIAPPSNWAPRFASGGAGRCERHIGDEAIVRVPSAEPPMWWRWITNNRLVPNAMGRARSLNITRQKSVRSTTSRVAHACVWMLSAFWASPPAEQGG